MTWHKPVALGFVLLSVLTLITYFPSLNNEFTNWDDDVYLSRNEMIYNFTGENIMAMFNWNNPVSANYHPVTILSLAINHHFHQLEPFGYHLVNLLFHMLNTFLVFYFLFFLTKQRWEWAFIAALLFGIHPMHVESVAWVSERKDVLYAFFFLLGLISYLRYIRQKKMVFLIVAFLLFLLSVLSKAMAVVFPLVLLLIDYWENRINLKDHPDLKIKRTEPSALVKILLEKAPFFALSLLFGIIAYQVQQAGGAVGEMQTFSLPQRIMFASYGFVMYIAKLFVPIQLSTFYPYPSLDEVKGTLPIVYYIFPFVVLATLAVTAWSFKKTKIFIFGIGFYLATVVLVLQLLSVGQVVMAERYSYLPYIGIGFILGAGFSYLWRSDTFSQSIKYGVAGITGVYFLVIGFLAFQQCKVWQNSETLWTQVINLHQYKVDKAYKNRGNYRAANGRIDEGLKDFEIAIQLAPNDAGLYESLANSYASRQEFQKALPYFDKALAKEKTKPSIFYNRGIVHAQMKNYDKALADLNKSNKLGQSLLSILPNRAFIYLEKRQYKESIADYNQIIQKKPKDAASLNNRGRAKIGANDLPGAIQDLNRTLQINPNQKEAHYFLAIAHFRNGDIAKAKQSGLKAKSLGYTLPANVAQGIGL